jgi:hypothetical protein
MLKLEQRSLFFYARSCKKLLSRYRRGAGVSGNVVILAHPSNLRITLLGSGCDPQGYCSDSLLD